MLTTSSLTAIIYLCLGVPLAGFAWWMAPKMGARRCLWVPLMLLPFINFLALQVMILRALGAILDKLDRPDAPSKPVHLK